MGNSKAIKGWSSQYTHFSTPIPTPIIEFCGKKVSFLVYYLPSLLPLPIAWQGKIKVELFGQDGCTLDYLLFYLLCSVSSNLKYQALKLYQNKVII